LSGERADKRSARWQDIVVSACEQSGRNVVPKVLPLLPYREALAGLPEGSRLLMSLNQARSLNSIKPDPQGIVLMAGPEGGWTEAEERLAFDAGFESVKLGPRVLRTETAALAAIAAAQALWGDFA
ncbi:16S rRNA (uracil(1498)-N(3))-methyltransferase, partial [Neisseria dentiae]